MRLERGCKGGRFPFATVSKLGLRHRVRETTFRLRWRYCRKPDIWLARERHGAHAQSGLDRLLIRARKVVPLATTTACKARGPHVKLSTRNVLPGKVVAVTKGSTTAHVKIELASGLTVTSSITNEAVDELALKVGDSVSALIKASDVMIGK
jgi:molybdopterin-binding protein